jgi:hypothetical protein
MSHEASHKLSLAERGICWGCVLIIIVMFMYIALNPRDMNEGTLAIVRFLAALLAGLAGGIFSGSLSLTAKVPYTRTQIKAGGGFASFAVVLLLFYFGIPTPKSVETPRSQTFNSPKDAICKFNGEYPKNWTYKVTNNPITYEILVFTPVSQDSPKTKFIIQCNVPKNISSISEYVKEFTSSQKDVRPDSIKSKEVIFANREARQLIYTKLSEPSLKFQEVIALNRGKIYQVTYVSEIKSFDKYEKEVDQMVKSFKITES